MVKFEWILWSEHHLTFPSCAFTISFLPVIVPCVFSVKMEGVLDVTLRLCVCKLMSSMLLCSSVITHTITAVSLCCCCLLVFTDLAVTGKQKHKPCPHSSHNSPKNGKCTLLQATQDEGKDEQRSYGFGTISGEVINDRIYIFGWTIPLVICVYFVIAWLSKWTSKWYKRTSTWKYISTFPCLHEALVNR